MGRGGGGGGVKQAYFDVNIKAKKAASVSLKV